jgi:hypothetical protein
MLDLRFSQQWLGTLPSPGKHCIGSVDLQGRSQAGNQHGIGTEHSRCKPPKIRLGVPYEYKSRYCYRYTSLLNDYSVGN